MTVTDDRPLVRCSFCIDGHVYAGVYDRPKRCLVCLGTGRIPALDCPLCCEPLADDHSKVYSVAGRPVSSDHRAVHLDCLPFR